MSEVLRARMADHARVMCEVSAVSARCADAFARFARQMHDALLRHDIEHRQIEPRRAHYCLTETDPRRCIHGDCCAAATQEDFLCDGCRADGQPA